MTNTQMAALNIMYEVLTGLMAGGRGGEGCPKEGHMALQAVQQLLRLVHGSSNPQLAPPGIGQPAQGLQPRS